jgi:hypothetical protein
LVNYPKFSGGDLRFGLLLALLVVLESWVMRGRRRRRRRGNETLFLRERGRDQALILIRKESWRMLPYREYVNVWSLSCGGGGALDI